MYIEEMDVLALSQAYQCVQDPLVSYPINALGSFKRLKLLVFDRLF